jgi:hypothetical protein
MALRKRRRLQVAGGRFGYDCGLSTPAGSCTGMIGEATDERPIVVRKFTTSSMQRAPCGRSLNL